VDPQFCATIIGIRQRALLSGDIFMAKLPSKQPNQMRMTVLVGIMILGFLLLHLLVKPVEEEKFIKFSEFVTAVKLPAGDPNKVTEVTFRDNTIAGVRADKSTFRTFGPADADLRKDLQSSGISVNYEPAEEASWWKALLINSLPMLLLLFLFFYLYLVIFSFESINFRFIIFEFITS
jgi:cell division protease FtsH